MTLEYLGLWEELYNPSFNPLGFEGFRKEVGLNSFTISPSKWIVGMTHQQWQMENPDLKGNLWKKGAFVEADVVVESRRRVRKSA